MNSLKGYENHDFWIYADRDKYNTSINENLVCPIFKFELLNPDETTREDISDDVINSDGSLEINLQNGIRRNLTLKLINSGAKWVPQANTDLWIHDKVALSLGIKIGEDNYWSKGGVFVISNPQLISNYSDQTVTFSAPDKYCLLNDSESGTLADYFTIPAGTTLYDAIKMVWNLANDPVQPCIAMSLKNYALPSDIRKEVGDKIDDLFSALNDWHPFYYYYDVNGIFRAEENTPNYFDTLATTWEYSTSDRFYMGSTITINSNAVYNKIIVTGANVNGNVITASYENTNLRSGFNTNRMPLRVKPVNDTSISTYDEALYRAKVEMQNCLINAKTIEMYLTYIPDLDVNTVFELSDPNIKAWQERYLIKSLSIPITTASKIKVDAACIDGINIL